MESSSSSLVEPTEGAGGFYARMGYTGRGSMVSKGLPLSSPFVEARVQKLIGPGARLMDVLRTRRVWGVAARTGADLLK